MVLATPNRQYRSFACHRHEINLGALFRSSDSQQFLVVSVAISGPSIRAMKNVPCKSPPSKVASPTINDKLRRLGWAHNLPKLGIVVADRSFDASRTLEYGSQSLIPSSDPILLRVFQLPNLEYPKILPTKLSWS